MCGLEAAAANQLDIVLALNLTHGPVLGPGQGHLLEVCWFSCFLAYPLVHVPCCMRFRNEATLINKASVVQRWLPKELREDALKAAREPVLGGGDVEITFPAVARRRRRKKEAKKIHRYTNGSFSGRATERVASQTASTMP